MAWQTSLRFLRIRRICSTIATFHVLRLAGNTQEAIHSLYDAFKYYNKPVMMDSNLQMLQRQPATLATKPISSWLLIRIMHFAFLEPLHRTILLLGQMCYMHNELTELESVMPGENSPFQ